MVMISNITFKNDKDQFLCTILDFAPQVLDLQVIPNTTSGPLPAVTLSWRIPFTAAPPSSYQLTYGGTQLSDMNQIPDNTTTTTLVVPGGDVQDAANGTGEYVVKDLLFYANYSFSLVAAYDTGNEQLAQSSAVVATVQTEQGGE